ncbi:hypothetical protein MTO96_015570 [Rhipicephalus appendiculatus]
MLFTFQFPVQGLRIASAPCRPTAARPPVSSRAWTVEPAQEFSKRRNRMEEPSRTPRRHYHNACGFRIATRIRLEENFVLNEPVTNFPFLRGGR